MTRRETPEDRWFDIFTNWLERLEKKIDVVDDKVAENTVLTKEVKTQAEKTNGRVSANEVKISNLEKEVFGNALPNDLPVWWRDPVVRKTAYYIALALLVLVIAATKTNLNVLDLAK